MFRFGDGWRCLPSLSWHRLLKDSAAMTTSVTIVPAQPGFFIAHPVAGDDPPEAVLDPIIAWQVHTTPAVGVFVIPITVEDGAVDPPGAVVRPDGTVVHNDSTYPSVADWLKTGDHA